MNKLRKIPRNTVVYTPTEAEAEELLTILKDNGYDIRFSYNDIKQVNNYKDGEVCFRVDGNGLFKHSKIKFFQQKGYTIIPFFKFKEQYCIKK